jgi:uncharacterized repeat protein (TIGR03803 family)
MTKLKHFGIALRVVSGALALAVVLVPAVVVVVLAAPPAQAQTYSVLYSFHGFYGEAPLAGLIQDKEGNLYGTTAGGGVHNYGVVFKLKADGKEKVLYRFASYRDGWRPQAGLVRDSAGNLYGTTWGGGGRGGGAVFKLDTTGAETVLHSFTLGAGGGEPVASLVRDSAGNLYGTTNAGGAYNAGVVFKLNANGKEKVLHTFTGGADGLHPVAALVRDSAGNLYGTTYGGGAYGAGAVFKLDTTGAETVLYSFTGGADGASPQAGLLRDSAGNLYGTTYGGAYGAGVVFKLDTTGAETVLYSFTGGADGASPTAGVVRDSADNLYGTTYKGGAYNWGTVFKLDTTGAETVLHSFTGGADGAYPFAGLVRDSSGNLYSTTVEGGAYGYGVVFKITPQ